MEALNAYALNAEVSEHNEPSLAVNNPSCFPTIRAIEGVFIKFSLLLCFPQNGFVLDCNNSMTVHKTLNHAQFN